MKKLLIFLPILFVVTLVFPNNISFTSPAKQVIQPIRFSVCSGSNYTAAAYDSSMAQVTVTVQKVSAGNKMTTVLSKTYDARQLKQYPAAGQARAENLQVVKGKEDILLVTSTVTYSNKGNVLTLEYNNVIDKNNTQPVQISL